MSRTTIDVEFIGLVPNPVRALLVELAGRESPLRKKHRVYLDAVTIATAPEDYEERLTPLFPGTWTNLRLFILEAHDLALAKLDRNIDRDRHDVQRLAAAGHIRKETLERYQKELRPYLTREATHDLTIRLWIESCWPDA